MTVYTYKYVYIQSLCMRLPKPVSMFYVCVCTVYECIYNVYAVYIGIKIYMYVFTYASMCIYIHKMNS